MGGMNNDDVARSYGNIGLQTLGGKLSDAELAKQRADQARGMAAGGPGYAYFQGQLAQTDAIQRAAPDASYGGVNESEFNARARDAQQRGPTLADYGNAYGARGMSMDARGQMVDATGMARMAAMGQGPSAAQAQLQAGSDAAARMAMAQAASARGGVARAGAMRAGMMGAQDATQNAAAQAAMLRAQEQQQGMQLYGGLAGQLRGADMQQQGLDASMSQFQAQQALANRNANDQYAMGLMGLGQNAARAQQQSALSAREDWMRNFYQSQAHKNAADLGYAGLEAERASMPAKIAAGFANTALAGGMMALKGK